MSMLKENMAALRDKLSTRRKTGAENSSPAAASATTAGDSALRVLSLKQGALIAFVLILTGILPVFVNHPIGYAPLICFLFMLLMSWGYLMLVSKRLLVDAHLEEGSATRGKRCELPVVLKNRSKLPILKAQVNLTIGTPGNATGTQTSTLTSIDAMDDQPINASVTMGHVGVYTAGACSIVLFDPLGLLHKGVGCEHQSIMVSTPQEVNIDNVELSRVMMHQSHTPVRTVISDDVDYAGVRDYEFGDPLKSIHWKLSARSENLLTRLFETTVSTSTSVVMDFHAPSYQAEELMTCTDTVVELSLACARLVKARNMELRLCFADSQGNVQAGDAPSTAELDAFTKALPICSPDVDAELAAELVSWETGSQHGSDNLILCTSSLERSMMARLNEARAKHVQVTVLLTVPQELTRSFYTQHQGLMQELEAAGMACIVVNGPQDLEVSVDE